MGGFVLKGYDISEGPYLDGLVVRLRDKGVSVRKTVVGILKDTLLFQPDHPRYSELCLALLERGAQPKEEESIKEVVRATFQQVWFLPPSTSAIRAQSRPRKSLPSSSSSSAMAIDETTSSAECKESESDVVGMSESPRGRGARASSFGSLGGGGKSKQDKGSDSKGTRASSSGGDALSRHLEATAMQMVDVVSD